MTRTTAVPSWRRAVLAAAALASAGVAVAQTPPPFFCGTSYVFAMGGELTASADRAGTVHVDTTHFLELVALPGQCAPGNANLTLEAVLACEGVGEGEAQPFGPFPLEEGFTQIVLPVDVPAGPPRTCTLSITATVSFDDGTVIAQTADQKVCVVEPSDDDPLLPRLAVTHRAAGTAFAHPGDQRSFSYRLTNNDPTHAFTGLLTVDMRNVADVPEVIAGPNDTARGVFAIADPQGDDFPIAFADRVPAGFCLATPEPAHLHAASVVQRPFSIPPGSFADVDLAVRSWPLTADGAVAESTAILAGSFADGSSASACAGAVFAVDHGAVPDLACDGAGHAALGAAGVVPGGPAATLFFPLEGAAAGPPAGGAVAAAGALPAGDVPVDVDFGVPLSTMGLLINGVPIVDGTPAFTGVTQVDGHHVRLVTEFSFISPLAPPEAVLTMFYDILVEPGAEAQGEITTQTGPVEIVAGAPTGFAEVAPIAAGAVDIADAVPGGGAYEIDPKVLRFAQQLSAVGVEKETFAQVAMTHLGTSFTRVDANRYRVASSWTATKPGTRSMIGFDISNDFRGFAADAPPAPCPADLDGDGRIAFDDLLELLAAWGRSGHPADLDGDGVVGLPDLMILLSSWGACPREQIRYSSRFDDVDAVFTLRGGQPADTMLHGDMRLRAMDPDAPRSVVQMALDELTFRANSVGTPDGPSGGVSFVLRDPRPAIGFWDRKTGDFAVDVAFDVHHALIDDAQPWETTEDNADFTVNGLDLWTGTLSGTVFEDPESGALVFEEGGFDGFLVPSQPISDGLERVQGGAPPRANPKPGDPGCAERDRANKRVVCLQPFFINDDAGGNPTGASLDAYRAAADAIYARCCVELVWREPMTIDSSAFQEIDGPFPVGRVTQEELDLGLSSDPFGRDDCIEVFFVRRYVNPAHGRGGGLTLSSGTARARIIIQDEAVTMCDPPSTRSFGHELGHALGKLPHDEGTIMEPGCGEGTDCPPECPTGGTSRITREQCGKLRNPLLREKDPKESCCLDPGE